LLLRLAVGLNGILKYEISEVAIDYFMKDLGIAELFDNVILNPLWRLVNAHFNKLGRKLILG
jgi:hypothetical protein